MAQFLTCPNGHRWELSDDSKSSRSAPICPICSAAGSLRTLQVMDELPPLPQPQIQPARASPLRSFQAAGYEILGELGRGGMGVVYKARQTSLNRLVALKMLPGGTIHDAEALTRLRVEALTVARLQHPHIVHIYDIGVQEGCTYLALEYMEGGSLAQKLAQRPWPARDAAHLVATLARAAQAAHERRIIHRDLKPANVLLMADGTPKIADFGLAKNLGSDSVTQTGVIMGSPCYMAPEQAEGLTKEIGPHTDVYSLGVILYEMLTGRPPFLGATPLAVVRQVVSDEPTPPSSHQKQISSDLEAICLRCLRKNPRERYASAKELADALQHLLDDKTAEIARTKPDRSESPGWARLWWAAGGAMIVVTFVLLIWSRMPLWPWTPIADSTGSEKVKDNAVRASSDGTKPEDADPKDPDPKGANGKGTNAKGTKPSAKNGNEAPLAQQKPKPAREPKWEILPAIGANEEKFARLAFPTREVGFAASNRAIYKTVDAGLTWKAIFQPAFLKSGNFQALGFRDALVGWLGSNNKLYGTTDGGDSWIPADLNVRVFDLALSRKDPWVVVVGTMEPAGFPEALFKKRGITGKWTDLLFAKRGAVEGRNGGASLVAVSGAQTIWIGCTDSFQARSTLLRSSDGGKSWKAVFTSENRRLRALHFDDLGRGWVSASSFLWHTEDGGDTWKAQLNPEEHAIRALAFDPQGSQFGLALLEDNRDDGKLLFTTNGALWRTTNLGIKGTPVHAAVVDGACAYVLLEDGRVCRDLDPEFRP
ncbi:MAG: protein kinase [Planctomycetes bacterium]|nr:protein kinase [Planctomycetota bacterium]